MAKKEQTNEEFIAEYEELLRIDQNDLDNAVIEHPELYWHVCRRYKEALSQRDMAKDELKSVDARLYNLHKQTIEDSGARATEALVNAAVESDGDHISYREEYRDWCLETDLLESLKAAYEQRSYAMRELVELYCVNYNATAAISKPSREASDARQQADRAALNSTRKTTVRKKKAA